MDHPPKGSSPLSPFTCHLPPFLCTFTDCDSSLGKAREGTKDQPLSASMLGEIGYGSSPQTLEAIPSRACSRIRSLGFEHPAPLRPSNFRRLLPNLPEMVEPLAQDRSLAAIGWVWAPGMPAPMLQWILQQTEQLQHSWETMQSTLQGSRLARLLAIAYEARLEPAPGSKETHPELKLEALGPLLDSVSMTFV